MRLRTYVVRVDQALLASGTGAAGRPVTTRYRPERKPQDYVDRLIKLIPGEVIISYPIIAALLNEVPSKVFGASLSCGLALLITVCLRSIGLRKEERMQWAGIVMSAVAAVLWVYEQGGYFILAVPSGYESVPKVLAIAYSIIVPGISIYAVKGDEIPMN